MHNNNIHSQTPGGTSETKKKKENKGGDMESRDMDTTSGWLM